jgi:hypothetical protein
MSAMLIGVLFLAGQMGQNHWCYVPPQSEQLFCDYVSMSSCQWPRVKVPVLSFLS